MTKVSPSVMCMDLLNFRHQLEILDKAGIDYYHIDVMDGHYVPNFSLNGSTVKTIASVSRTPQDVHLMITNPMDYIDYFADAGAEIITMHLETLDHPIRALNKVHAAGKKAGIAISPATGIESFEYMMDYLDLVCVMTVEPGYASQQLIPSTLDKIRRLRAMFDAAGKKIEIMVDGNVSEAYAPKMVEAGADILVLGTSGLFHKVPEEKYPEAIRRFQELSR